MRHDVAPDAIPLDAVRQALRRQFVAALSMLRDAIRRCPDALWSDASRPVTCCEIACAAAFLTRYYAHQGHDAFRPWPGMELAHATDDGGALVPETDGGSSVATSRTEVLAYVDHLMATLESSLTALDLSAPTSGFYWHRMPKLEHQLMSLRHLQHHTAQLVDRVRASTGASVTWIDGDRSDTVN